MLSMSCDCQMTITIVKIIMMWKYFKVWGALYRVSIQNHDSRQSGSWQCDSRQSDSWQCDSRQSDSWQNRVPMLHL